MATLKSIKKRIVSVKNTQKITKAMKMVAAAKLRRAQSAVVAARPFVFKLRDVVEQIMRRGESSLAHQPEANDDSPLLHPHESVKNVKLYVFSSNRGLCGGFNSNLLRYTFNFLKELQKNGATVQLIVIGKKGREFFTARGIAIHENILPWADALNYDDALTLTESLAEQYRTNSVDEVYFLYNKFVSAISVTPTAEKLLPLSFTTEPSYGIDFIYEPSKAQILNDVLPRYMASQVNRIHKESLASELGSRMSAMDSATKNASEMIGLLTLKYNRARQAAITTELMDIVNGAESLK